MSNKTTSNKTRSNKTRTNKTKSKKIIKEKHINIGSGTYGCVYKPSIKCKNKKNLSYKNKVSKLMEDYKAKEEYNKMKTLKNIKTKKKYNYILNPPIICQPLINKHNAYVIKDCDVFHKEKFQHKHFIEYPEYIRHYANILVMDDAGVNLDQFMKYLFKYLTKNDKNIFLTKILTLIEGIQFFKTHKIVHHDIKPNNIMYNPYKTEFKFIDFGLETSFKNYIKNSISGLNTRATSHFNFPPESSCINKDKFNKKYKCETYKDFMNYNEFLKKNVETFDSYSFAIALKNILETVKLIDASYKLFCNNILIYLKPYHANILYRQEDLSQLIELYIRILKKYDIYNNSNNVTTSYKKIDRIINRIGKNKTKEKKYKFATNNK
tara:strand:- start:774 stop:1910 length:1137 start_codon:yes stop_codon:yes gene_type:complete